MKKAPHRILCWDDKMIETSENVYVQAHKPQKKNVALVCDNEWEGVHNGYAGLIKIGDVYRLYYRADCSRHRIDKKPIPGKAVICVAESRDGGITFRKPNIGQYEYNGTKNNNIVFSRDQHIDNFSVFYDLNPDCPKEQKFKALCELNLGNEGGTHLIYYSSEDGYTFKEEYALDVQGTFDSYNVVFLGREYKTVFSLLPRLPYTRWRGSIELAGICVELVSRHPCCYQQGF